MDFGGGVGVDEMTGGVLDLLLGAGDAGGLEVGSFTTSPSGFLITIAALLRGLRWIAEVAGFGCGV